MSFERHSQGHFEHSKSNEMHGSIVDLKNPRVQGTLAMLEFPDDTKSDAITKWMQPDGNGISLADRYGGLRDEIGDREVDLDNETEMREILEKVRTHAPDTLH